MRGDAPLFLITSQSNSLLPGLQPRTLLFCFVFNVLSNWKSFNWKANVKERKVGVRREKTRRSDSLALPTPNCVN